MTSHPVRLLGAVAGCAVVLAALAVPVGPALADPTDCSVPGKMTKSQPWAQKLLDPDRLRPFTDGAGVKVAVVDSGVDATQPLLAGHVAKGSVVKVGSSAKSADTDCLGEGTQVAGIIVAQPSDQTGFHGVAPGVTIVPIRDADILTSTPASSGSVDAVISPHTQAKAIDAAVAQGVDVISLQAAATGGTDELKAAVKGALDHNIVVVSAVGDNSVTNSQSASKFPACYPGVIGVGAIKPDLSLIDNARPDSCIDLVAPGDKVTTTQLGSGLIAATGTQIATPFVSATAALVRAYYGAISPNEVEKRIEATATPAPGGADNADYGHGIVNPYQAVADTMAGGPPAPLPAMVPKHKSSGEIAWDHRWSSSSGLAAILTGAVLLLTLLVVLAAIAIPHGRRQRWKARQAAPPVDDPEADMPSPPIELFKESETAR